MAVATRTVMPLHARNSANSLTVWLDPVCSGQKFEVMMATREATVRALMLGDEPLLHTGTSYQVQLPSLRMTVSPRCFVAAPRWLVTPASLRTKSAAIMPESGPDWSLVGGGGRTNQPPVRTRSRYLKSDSGMPTHARSQEPHRVWHVDNGAC